MPPPFVTLLLGVVVPLALLPLADLVSPSTSSSSSATAAAADEVFLQQRPPASASHNVAVPAGAGCSRSAGMVEGCTDDIVRSFFGIRGSDLCCHALETVGAACYRVMFADSPFSDLYETILGNVCGGGASAIAPRPARGKNSNGAIFSAPNAGINYYM